MAALVHSCDPMAVPDAGPPPDSRKTPVFRRFSPPQLRQADKPQLYPIRSGIAAHCHPSLWPDWGHQASCSVALPGIQMSNRSVRFVPALYAGVVAGANLATMTDLRAQVMAAAPEAAAPLIVAAADSCLSAPKGAMPSGSHWYYRIDRVTKRQCWYLREENDSADDKFARAAPPASAPAPAAAPAPASASAAEEQPQPPTITRKSIADARAEWVSQQPRAEPNSPAKVEPRTVAAAPAAAEPNSPRAT